MPRRMLLPDLDRVIRTEREIYPFPWSRANFEDSIVAGHEGWLVESPGDEEGDTRSIIGYAMLMWAVDEVHLLNFSIAAPCQRQGRGRWLLEWLCADCAHRGAVSILLEVRPSNPPALGLYETAGFARIGLRRDYYPSFEGRREDAIVMRRLLQGAGPVPPRGTAR